MKLYDLLHIRIPRRNPATANAERGRKALNQPLILDHLSHAGLEERLSLCLGLGALVEAAP